MQRYWFSFYPEFLDKRGVGMGRQPELIGQIGQRLYDERMKLKLTQIQIAEILGISSQWYGKVERGFSRPSIEMLNTLYEKFNIDLTQLITGQGENNLNLNRLIGKYNQEQLFLIETVIRNMGMFAKLHHTKK
jgi:transcriptional regulator with XRE-family HTH domain